MRTPSSFVRTSAVWSLYALLGLFAFLQNAIGPAVPFLRAEFHLDYTLAALHMSAFALGMMVSGVIAPTLIRRFGIQAALWGGQGGMLAGLTALVLAPEPWVSLIAILAAGLTGTVGLAAIQISVADQAGPHRGKALLEANMAASLTSAAAPFVLVLGTFGDLGWRTLAPVFALALAATALFGWKPLQTALKHLGPAPQTTAKAPLPRSYLRAWLLIFFGVGVEWCVGFWAAEYLKGLPGGSVGLAAAGVGVFQLAAVAGRLIASRLAGRWGERNLLWAAIAITAAGFPLYWSLAHPVVSFAGLILCGLGVSTFYPLGLSTALGAAASQEARGSSLATLASGGAILTAPLILGALADQWGLACALFSIPLGLFAMIFLLFQRKKG